MLLCKAKNILKGLLLGVVAEEAGRQEKDANSEPSERGDFFYGELNDIGMDVGGRAAAIKSQEEFLRVAAARNEAETKRREGEERFKKALAALQVGVWDWDLQTDSFFWSPEARTIFGLEGKGDRLESLIEELQPVDSARFLVAVNRALSDESVYSAECNITLPDGGSRRVATTVQAVFGEDRKPKQVIGTVREVNRSEDLSPLTVGESWERAIDGVSDPTMIIGSDHRIRRINGAMGELIGMPAEAARGRKCYELLHQSCTPPAGCPHAMLLEDGRPHTARIYEPTLRKHLSVTVSPIFDADGGRGPCVHFIKDLSGRVGKQDECRENESVYRLLFEEMTSGFAFHEVVYDQAGAPSDYRFLAVNSVFAAMMGLPAADLVGKTARELKPDVDDLSIRRLVKVALTGKSIQFEEHRKDTGKYFRVKAYSPEPRKFAVVVTDVTKQKSLEEQLRHSQKMEAVGMLAGGVAHNFNNILTVVVSQASLLEMKLPEDDPLTSHVTEIISAADRAVALTKSLLRFSRKQVLDRRKLDLNDIVGKLENLLSAMVKRNIRLEYSLSDQPLMVHADLGQIEQVLMNIVGNAVDAMPEGGELLISSGRAELDHEVLSSQGLGVTDGYAFLSITDSGTGMDKKTREKIFEPFFTTKDPDKGTGLGLSISYSIIRQHNGYLDCISQPGQGSTFSIFLPLVGDVANDTECVPEEDQVSPKAPKILLVEDDPLTRVTMGRVLERHGFRVIEAADGKDAVERFKAEAANIQLVVSDLVMPKMDGLSAIHEIRKMAPHVRVLLVSACTDGFFRGRDLLAEGYEFIAKPVRLDNLIAKVRELSGNGGVPK